MTFAIYIFKCIKMTWYLVNCQPEGLINKIGFLELCWDSKRLAYENEDGVQVNIHTYNSNGITTCS